MVDDLKMLRKAVIMLLGKQCLKFSLFYIIMIVNDENGRNFSQHVLKKTDNYFTCNTKEKVWFSFLIEPVQY